MAIFVVLWSYLLTIKLSCLQKNNFGHTNSRYNFVDVVVEILDENDNSPLFLQPTTNITVREDTPPDSIIAKLEALDLDSGQFGQITYFLDRSSSYGGQFQIHPDTGELSTGKDSLE